MMMMRALATSLVVYYQVLSHWNRKINLTSLSDPDEAVDRLAPPHEAELDRPAGGERSRLTAPD